MFCMTCSSVMEKLPYCFDHINDKGTLCSECMKIQQRLDIDYSKFTWTNQEFLPSSFIKMTSVDVRWDACIQPSVFTCPMMNSVVLLLNSLMLLTLFIQPELMEMGCQSLKIVDVVRLGCCHSSDICVYVYQYENERNSGCRIL